MELIEWNEGLNLSDDQQFWGERILDKYRFKPTPEEIQEEIEQTFEANPNIAKKELKRHIKDWVAEVEGDRAMAETVAIHSSGS